MYVGQNEGNQSPLAGWRRRERGEKIGKRFPLDDGAHSHRPQLAGRFFFLPSTGKRGATSLPIATDTFYALTLPFARFFLLCLILSLILVFSPSPSKNPYLGIERNFVDTLEPVDPNLCVNLQKNHIVHHKYDSKGPS